MKPTGFELFALTTFSCLFGIILSLYSTVST
jgi:hypothetical protein